MWSEALEVEIRAGTLLHHLLKPSFWTNFLLCKTIRDMICCLKWMLSCCLSLWQHKHLVVMGPSINSSEHLQFQGQMKNIWIAAKPELRLQTSWPLGKPFFYLPNTREQDFSYWMCWTNRQWTTFSQEVHWYFLHGQLHESKTILMPHFLTQDLLDRLRSLSIYHLIIFSLWCESRVFLLYLT